MSILIRMRLSNYQSKSSYLQRQRGFCVSGYNFSVVYVLHFLITMTNSCTFRWISWNCPTISTILSRRLQLGICSLCRPEVYRAKYPVTPHPIQICPGDIIKNSRLDPSDEGSIKRVVYQKMVKDSLRVKLLAFKGRSFDEFIMLPKSVTRSLLGLDDTGIMG